MLIGLSAVSGNPAATAAEEATPQNTATAKAGDHQSDVSASEPEATRAADLARGVRITAGDEPIEVEGFAAPFVGDFDGDGRHDLLIGQRGQGRMRIYRNTGTNARPKFDSFEWFRAGGQIAAMPICCQAVFTPQLIDFDGDGDTDILTGEGFGNLYVFRRNPDGTFAEAEVLEDKHGELHMVRGAKSTMGRPYNSTVFAHDWDGDGDLDLLLGRTRSCLVLNEGTREQPIFGDAVALEQFGEEIPSGLAAPFVADWDGDGRDDLIIGRKKKIVWYRNTGTKGQPVLDAPRVLLGENNWSYGKEHPKDQPCRYHAVCVTDFNGDGRLDLLLGDTDIGHVDLPELTEEQKTRLDETRKKARVLLHEYSDLRRSHTGDETREETIDRCRKMLKKWQEYNAVISSLQQQTNRTRFRGTVWFYERLAAKADSPRQ